MRRELEGNLPPTKTENGVVLIKAAVYVDGNVATRKWVASNTVLMAEIVPKIIRSHTRKGRGAILTVKHNNDRIHSVFLVNYDTDRHKLLTEGVVRRLPKVQKPVRNRIGFVTSTVVAPTKRVPVCPVARP